MTRVIKIFKADIHGVMDQFEDQGLLLKQHLREMQDVLNLKEVQLNKMIVSRRQAQKDHNLYIQQAEVLEQDLAVAIKKNKDDIARMLIRKIQPLNNLCNDLSGHIRALDEEIAAGKDRLDQQRLQYDRLKARSIDFFNQCRVHERQRDWPDIGPDDRCADLSEEEIELELLKRKEALGTVLSPD
jgi:phage shock protein A